MSQLPSWARAWEESTSREPAHDKVKGPIRRKLLLAIGAVVLWLFQANDYLINRFGPDHDALWSPDEFDWAGRIAARTPEIRAELDAYLAGSGMPTTAENAGLDPDSPEGRRATNVDQGTWRALLLYVHGKWVEGAAQHFPRTIEAMREAPHFVSGGFSALEPHSHIATHHGPNKGGLRFQLPIIVPGEPGECRIRIESDMVVWSEGEPVMFDLACSHEAWNDSDGFRVLLMIEVFMPLPAGLALFNRFTQFTYRFHPSYRGMAGRAETLVKKHQGVPG